MENREILAIHLNNIAKDYLVNIINKLKEQYPYLEINLIESNEYTLTKLSSYPAIVFTKNGFVANIIYGTQPYEQIKKYLVDTNWIA